MLEVPMPSLEEITLTYRRERVRFDNGDDGPGVAIVECRTVEDDGQARDVTLKVECEPNDLTQGLDYRFYGRWVTHHRYGRQFQANTFVLVRPHGKTGVLRYLVRAPHVGGVTARTLWDKFDGNAVRILREQPEVASAAVGGAFNVERAKVAADWLADEEAMEATTIDLIDVLGGRGFPKSIGKRAVKEWGNKAAELIRRNPFLLMRFRGCGFLRCDQLYLDEGGDPARLKRQALCAWYSISRDTNGHTWHRPQLIEAGLKERISGTGVRPVRATRLALRGCLLASYRDRAGRLWLADSRDAANEEAIAARVRGMLNTEG